MMTPNSIFFLSTYVHMCKVSLFKDRDAALQSLSSLWHLMQGCPVARNQCTNVVGELTLMNGLKMSFYWASCKCMVYMHACTPSRTCTHTPSNEQAPRLNSSLMCKCTTDINGAWKVPFVEQWKKGNQGSGVFH